MSGGSVIAVDLGGTWIRVGAVSVAGEVGERHVRPTDRERAPDAILMDLDALISQAVELTVGRDDSVVGIAVGIPTTLEQDGVLAACPNLPSLIGFPLQRHLAGRHGLPVAVANDALCFTLGEWWRGLGIGTQSFCGITLGTGIGLGLVIHGRPYRGAHGDAGEIWRTPVDGRLLEEWVSGEALSGYYAEVTGVQLDGAKLASLAKSGDCSAQHAFAEYGRQLGTVLASVVNMIDPEAIALGGSIADSLALFSAPMLESLQMGIGKKPMPLIEASRLGSVAPLIGAAKVFEHEFGPRN